MRRNNKCDLNYILQIWKNDIEPLFEKFYLIYFLSKKSHFKKYKLFLQTFIVKWNELH